MAAVLKPGGPETVPGFESLSLRQPSHAGSRARELPSASHREGCRPLSRREGGRLVPPSVVRRSNGAIAETRATFEAQGFGVSKVRRTESKPCPHSIWQLLRSSILAFWTWDMHPINCLSLTSLIFNDFKGLWWSMQVLEDCRPQVRSDDNSPDHVRGQWMGSDSRSHDY